MSNDVNNNGPGEEVPNEKGHRHAVAFLRNEIVLVCASCSPGLCRLRPLQFREARYRQGPQP